MRLFWMIGLSLFLSLTACRSGGEAALAEGNNLLTSTDPADWERAADAFNRSIETEIKARNQLIRAWTKIGQRQVNEADKLTLEREDEMQTLLIAGTAKRVGMVAAEYELYTSAISNLSLAAKALPNDKMVWYYLGLSKGQLSRGELDLARSARLLDESDQAYEKATRLDPDFRNALYGRGIVLILKKEVEEAERVLQRLITLEPKEARGYFALGRVYYDREEYNKAANIYYLLREILPEKSHKRALVEENLQKIETLPRGR